MQGQKIKELKLVKKYASTGKEFTEMFTSKHLRKMLILQYKIL